jgi:hypothetical protein
VRLEHLLSGEKQSKDCTPMENGAVTYPPGLLHNIYGILSEGQIEISDMFF